jgi:hypothetical protein
MDLYSICGPTETSSGKFNTVPLFLLLPWGAICGKNDSLLSAHCKTLAQRLPGCIEYVFKTCLMLRWSLETICSKRYTLHKIPVPPHCHDRKRGWQERLFALSPLQDPWPEACWVHSTVHKHSFDIPLESGDDLQQKIYATQVTPFPRFSRLTHNAPDGFTPHERKPSCRAHAYP